MATNTFRNKGADVTTTPTQMYTAPTTAVIHAIYLANLPEGSEVMATISVGDVSEGRDFVILSRCPIGPGSSLSFDKPVNLEVGDSIKVSASVDNKMTAFLSALEIS